MRIRALRAVHSWARGRSAGNSAQRRGRESRRASRPGRAWQIRPCRDTSSTELLRSFRLRAGHTSATPHDVPFATTPPHVHTTTPRVHPQQQCVTSTARIARHHQATKVRFSLGRTGVPQVKRWRSASWQGLARAGVRLLGGSGERRKSRGWLLTHVYSECSENVRYWCSRAAIFIPASSWRSHRARWRAKFPRRRGALRSRFPDRLAN
jgi:hypothetical protein